MAHYYGEDNALPTYQEGFEADKAYAAPKPTASQDTFASTAAAYQQGYDRGFAMADSMPKPAARPCRHPKSALRDEHMEPCDLGGWCSKCGSWGELYEDKKTGLTKARWRRPTGGSR